MSDAETWWHCRSEYSEVLYGPEPTREAAIQAGRVDYDGEDFFVTKAKRQFYRCDIFDAEFLADQFSDHNEELAPEDGASCNWTHEQMRELERDLEGALSAWLDRHGHKMAWALDTGPYERITRDSDRHPHGRLPQDAVSEANRARAAGIAQDPSGSNKHG